MAPEQIAVLTQRAASGTPAVQFEFTPFAPAAAAAITGANVMYQKILRRRGVLTHSGEHARYDCFGLAMLMLTRMLSDRGGPQVTKGFASLSAWGVAWHSLRWNHSWAGDHERVLLWDSKLGAKIEAFHAATASLRHKSDWSREEALEELDRAVADPEVRAFNGWELQSLWLRGAVFKLRRFTQVPAPRFAVLTPDGRTAFTASVDRAFAEDRQQPQPNLSGPVVALDLEQLGWTLLTKMKEVTGGTFVTVHIGTKEPS